MRLAVGYGHGCVVDQRGAGQGAGGRVDVAPVVGLGEDGGHDGREGEELEHLEV